MISFQYAATPLVLNEGLLKFHRNIKHHLKSKGPTCHLEPSEADLHMDVDTGEEASMAPLLAVDLRRWLSFCSDLSCHSGRTAGVQVHGDVGLGGP